MFAVYNVYSLHIIYCNIYMYMYIYIYFCNVLLYCIYKEIFIAVVENKE